VIYVHSMGRAIRFYPNQPALSLGKSTVTFSQLHDRVKRIATTLSQAGFARRDRLALLLPNGPEYIELVYACSWLGIIVVPINTRLSAVEIDHVLADAAPRGLVRHSALPAPAGHVPLEYVVDQGHLDGGSGPCPEPCYEPDAVLALLYTSGTTGQPKGVTLTHSNVFSNVGNFNYWMEYREGGAYLHAAPIFHIADFPAMFAAPAFGVCQSALPRFDPKTFCETVASERINYTILVPTMMNLLAEFTENNPSDLSSLELLAYGGSPAAPELIRRTRRFLPQTRLVQVYGLSETGFLTGLRPTEHTDDHLTSCGRPCPGIELEVTDDSGNPVGTGQPGELAVRGANVMPGYWNNEVATAAVFRNGFFRTGDIGYQDGSGYVYMLDRLKDMIVTGGENVYSAEVEAVIFSHPAVREVAVFGIPDSRWGEIVAACVVLRPPAEVTADALTTYCRQSLAKFKVPRHVEFSEADLPKNPSGKVLKRLLRERFWVGSNRSVA
jgi:acyl-CoA synthetase (AMP-forming)/AMP-acid ligase II